MLAALAAAGASIGLTTATESPGPTEAAPTESPESPESPEPTTSTVPTSSLRLPAPAVLPDRVRWSMCVIVDAIALKRGYAAAGEMCEIPGVGPVSVDWARTLMDDAIIDVLEHDSVDIRAYASATRHKPRPVQLALMVRDRTCSVPGCRRGWRLQADHCDDFTRGGLTALVNLNGLCDQHHDEKTHRGARLEVTDTERRWWPPPPPPGSPPPPEGSVPWRAPIGEHLSRWDLGDLPDSAHEHSPPEPPDESPDESPDGADGHLPFG